MEFKLPDSILDIVLGSSYNPTGPDKEYTLRDELMKFGEDIEEVVYEVSNGKITTFTAWTKNWVICLLDDMMFGSSTYGLHRNPPQQPKFKVGDRIKYYGAFNEAIEISTGTIEKINEKNGLLFVCIDKAVDTPNKAVMWVHEKQLRKLKNKCGKI